LVEDGFAQRAKRGWLRFLDKPGEAEPANKGATAKRGDLRTRLLERVEEMPAEELAAAAAALDDTVGDPNEASPFESLRGDPDFILPEHPRPRYKKIAPVRVTGRPLSRDVLEDRR
jgi:hypothetical protein